MLVDDELCHRCCTRSHCSADEGTKPDSGQNWACRYWVSSSNSSEDARNPYTSTDCCSCQCICEVLLQLRVTNNELNVEVPLRKLDNLDNSFGWNWITDYKYDFSTLVRQRRNLTG